MKTALPLSQYIIQTLSADNPLQSQEDKVRFLNDAEPILKQIKAPRYALMLRKRIAELTGLTPDEMQSMVRLPALNQPRSRSRTELLPRRTISLQRRFALMILSKASLADEEDLRFLTDDGEDERVLRHVLETAIRQPQSNAAALLHQLEKVLDARTLSEIQRELTLLDENLDFALEVEGARRQLQELHAQRRRARLLEGLREKSLSQLTAEERELLRSLHQR